MMDIKRNISEIDDLDFDSKKHSKPGRKPVDTEPKSKRTAQNRAAQRAYRERKEKKLTDLEEKVKELQDENLKYLSDKEFLKSQVDILQNELKKYRGGNDANLSNNYKTEKVQTSDDFSIDFPWSKQNLMSRKKSYSNSPNEVRSNSYSKSSNLSSPLNDLISPTVVSSNSPHSSINTHGNANNKLNLFDSQTFRTSSSQENFNLDKNLSNLTSPHDAKNLFDSLDSRNLNSNLTTPNNQVSPGAIGATANKPQAGNFEEQVNPFCVELGEACGTKDDIIPKTLAKDSPFNFTNDYLNDPFFNDLNNINGAANPEANDPLSFLNDNNFDVNLAFTNNKATEVEPEFDPIELLTTEESVYDNFSSKNQQPQQTPSQYQLPNKEVDTNFNFNEFVKSSLENTKESKESPASKSEMVPKSPNVMKCSEIWDKISSHPKYSEIDIDGLCSELKSKAKCSEKGVVINSNDVNYLIEQSALLEKE